MFGIIGWVAFIAVFARFWTFWFERENVFSYVGNFWFYTTLGVASTISNATAAGNFEEPVPFFINLN